MTSKSQRLQLAKKSLDGLALGDCFGETFFGEPRLVNERIAEQQIITSPWPFTDDTIMGIGIYRILARFGYIHQDALSKLFGQNYLLDPQRGYGETAQTILRAIAEGKDWRQVSSAVFEGKGSMGNGAAMRVAPIGAYFFDDIQKVVVQARLSAEITHSNPEGIAGAVAVAVAAAQMAGSQDGIYLFTAADFILNVAKKVPDSNTKRQILSALHVNKDSPIRSVVTALGNGASATAQDTVPFAIWCAAHYADNLEEALWKAVSALGDRDTICAIVGSIVALNDDTYPYAWRKYREDFTGSPFFADA